jgi:chromate transporter
MPEVETPRVTGGILSLNLRELAIVFLRLGATAFGGPAAHVAMMEEEVVHKRRWLSRDEFLDLLGATNLIPGPNSTEMAVHIGRRRAGWPGILVAGSCFILPSTAIVLAISWAYARFRTLPQTGAVLYGIEPVIIAIVIHALCRLARSAVKSRLLAVVGVVSVVAGLLGVHELMLLFSAGVVVALVSRSRTSGGGLRSPRAMLCAVPLSGIAPQVLASAASAAASWSLGTLFLTFLKIGAVLYGSGYVLFAFLRADFVGRLHWITEAQLLDAVAVGQMTPGPVFTTATFIGYLLGGVKGAAVATAGIFLPAFAFVAASGPLVPRLRRSRTAGAFLDGVIVASLALLVAVTWQLGRAAIVDPFSLVLLFASAALLFGRRVNSAWLILGGAGTGLVARALW